MPRTTTSRRRGPLLAGGLVGAAGAVALAVAVSGALALPAGAVDPAPTSPSTSPSASPNPTPPVATTLALAAPARVVDEGAVRLTATWSTTAGAPVAGGVVTFEQRVSGTWRAAATRISTSTGRAGLTVTPRTDTVWRVRGAAGTRAGQAWQAAVSSVVTIDNVPPRTPLRLAGPAPKRLPAQARAVGRGPNAVVTRVPNAVWRSMVGRSWHRGCPVGRSGLRLLRVNYYGFDGYRHRGELVMSSAVIGRAAGALSDMHAKKLPLRAMYRVDRFGWSRALQGANDYASMGSDNTSGFNCRSVVNRPGVRSPHASGRAIDLNPWENPYRSASGWVPNTWWVTRSHPEVAWRSSDHPVVRIWRAHGFRWTYGNNDSQHWDGRRAPRLMGSFVG